VELQVLENIQDAIRGYLESLKKHNEAVPPSIQEEIAKGTLRSIIREAGLTLDEFKSVL